ncbi:MAG: hypothetical protein Q8S15_05970 [Erysipelotrichaceae bacterium]|nr:hypothetical protein [Erysipelotrichaceae bacterium]
MLKFAKILIIALMLVGCAEPMVPDPDPKPEPNKEELFKDPQGKSIASPVDIPYVYVNPIDIINLGGELTPELEIRGLKNKVIENKINQEISDKIDGLKSYRNSENLPPYRGIYTRIPAENIALNYNVYSYVTYNFNNVLSIVFTGYYTFNLKGSSEHVTVTDSLNYDLTTGKQLTVSDLLTNDANTKQALSDPLSIIIKKSMDSTDVLVWDRYPIDLVAPFKGIKGNQAFYLTNSGINFIFDYRNPEFNSQFQTIQLSVNFSKLVPNIAFTERFRSDQNIYEQPIRQAEFLDLSENMTREKDETVIYRSIEIYISEFISADVPQFYLDKLPKLLPLIQEMIDENVDTFDFENAYGNINADIIGEYLSLSMYYSIYTDPIIYRELSITYDAEGEVLTLEDLFVEGFYYRDVLWAQLLDTYPGYSSYDKETILDSANFTLYHSGINFSLKIPSEDNPSGSINFYVPYSIFGMENLTLFGYE